jgi:hypothetical protein
MTCFDEFNYITFLETATCECPTLALAAEKRGFLTCHLGLIVDNGISRFLATRIYIDENAGK